MHYRFVYSTVAKKVNSCSSLNNIKYQTTVLKTLRQGRSIKGSFSGKKRNHLSIIDS